MLTIGLKDILRQLFIKLNGDCAHWSQVEKSISDLINEPNVYSQRPTATLAYLNDFLASEKQSIMLLFFIKRCRTAE